MADEPIEEELTEEELTEEELEQEALELANSLASSNEGEYLTAEGLAVYAEIGSFARCLAAIKRLKAKGKIRPLSETWDPETEPFVLVPDQSGK